MARRLAGTKDVRFFKILPPEGDKREQADRGFSRRPTFLWLPALLEEEREGGGRGGRKGPQRSINARRFRFLRRERKILRARNPFRGYVLCFGFGLYLYTGHYNRGKSVTRTSIGVF